MTADPTTPNPRPYLDRSLAPSLPRSPPPSSYNQGANGGVSNFGTLSAFDFQPKNRDFQRKVLNENCKT